MWKYYFFSLLFIANVSKAADNSKDVNAVKQAALDYIESQHLVAPERMKNSLHKDLAKRTYWRGNDNNEFIMETNFDTMIKIAESYNKDGNRFPKAPRKEVKVLDIDKRVASVKLIADDWIDYMHLIKDENGDWKIVNVLWQYHNIERHRSKK